MAPPSIQDAPQTDSEDLTSIVRDQKRLIDHLLSQNQGNGNQNDLRDAIMQCAREEVRSALQSLGCLNNGETLTYPRRKGGAKSRRSDTNATDVQNAAKRRRNLRNRSTGHRHLPHVTNNSSSSCRPTTAVCGQQPPTSSGDNGKGEIEPTTRAIYSESQRPQTVSLVTKRPGATLSSAKSRLPRPIPLSLETVKGASSDKHAVGDGIDLSSFQWLEKSADVVLSTTGRVADDICQGVAPIHCGSSNREEPKANIVAQRQRPKTSLGLSSPEDGHGVEVTRSPLLRVSQSFPSIPTPHSSTSKPMRRPTTALERRKPRPTSASLFRSKAEQMAKRMLGPIDLDAKPSTAPLPSTLDENEWENQIARNIVTLYSNKVVTELKTAEDQVDSSVVTDGENDTTTSSSGRGSPPQHVGLSSHADDEKTTAGPKDNKHGRVRFKSRLPKLAPPVNPKMIWYCGTGRIRVDWSPLNEMMSKDSNFCASLENMEADGKYLPYVERVETLLQAAHVEKSNSRSAIKSLWRQLVLTCNGFAVKVIEQRRKKEALELLDKAQRLIVHDSIIPEEEAKQLTAFVKDSYAYYYSRRNKPSAALQYVLSAIRTHKRRGDSMNVAKCTLHKAYILTQLNRYTESMECMGHVLGMLQDGSLDLDLVPSSEGKGQAAAISPTQQSSSDSGPQAVLLVAVAYHNVAVQQLILGYVGDACLSSQNARRLARLCLSIGSRYIPTLEATHRRALGKLAAVLRTHQTDREAAVFEKLINQLFD